MTLQAFKSITLMAAMACGLSLSCARADQLTVAGGCFWCVESDFESVQGVGDVVSGFTGGTVANPTYKQVVRGGTGHLEAVQINFDESQISTDQILHLFFRSIDATDAGGQFCDRGHSYSTAVFVANDAQRAAAERAKAEAEAELGQKIVTPILPAGAFYAVDEYHQDYYKQSKKILTRFGLISKKDAYKRYRTACGRDARVQELWGNAAPFAGS
ncbi:peptide methionine sulfoxide reductase [Actibacterium mucosum KCTC 23349]|uniref:Peptide methionine sulfoxide reductase MsrA n=2 Tax=Actibacterium TaxID=1433986 RepID=A0A037ZQX4_9RHOB|nr:peptide methionine sulfoxide reductase [Actibacterium mucosum KCTC 23349]